MGLLVERIDVMNHKIKISGPNAAIADQAMKATEPDTELVVDAV